MNKVFCKKCKFFSMGAYGSYYMGEPFIFRDCKSEQNKFLVIDNEEENYIEKDPSEINKNNDCSFYEEASDEAIEFSKVGKIRGPYEFYHKPVKEIKQENVIVKKDNWFLKIFKRIK